jgi:twitching motility protein PilT
VTSLSELLAVAKQRGASDLLVMVGDAPAMRVNGTWHRFDQPSCRDPYVQAIAEDLLRPDTLDTLLRDREMDFSRTIDPVGRVRVNLHFQRDHLAMTLRLVWPEIPDARRLGIPPHVIQMGGTPHGLILVSGPTGSGKSTTLAAMVQHINMTRPAHIITIEDPIEYIYVNRHAIIEQREIGADTHSWHSALRNVLRQAPDVILLGELRDLESIAVALVAAETGHLVMASVHASTAVGAVSRIVDAFPPSQAAQARLQLSQTLRMVFGQRLVPGTERETRVLLYEILMGTPAISNMIRANELDQVQNAISSGREHGMVTFAQCERELAALLAAPPARTAHLAAANGANGRAALPL